MYWQASTCMASPESSAVLDDHFMCTVGLPRRMGASSMMSSWMSVKLWNASSAMAGYSAWSILSENRLQASSASDDRMYFPPVEKVYRMGSYSPNGSRLSCAGLFRVCAIMSEHCSKV